MTQPQQELVGVARLFFTTRGASWLSSCMSIPASDTVSQFQPSFSKQSSFQAISWWKTERCIKGLSSFTVVVLWSYVFNQLAVSQREGLCHNTMGSASLLPVETWPNTTASMCALTGSIADCYTSMGQLYVLKTIYRPEKKTSGKNCMGWSYSWGPLSLCTVLQQTMPSGWYEA